MHRFSNNHKLSSEQLFNLLLLYKLNTRRNGTEDIEESLISTGNLILNVVKDFMAKRKA